MGKAGIWYKYLSFNVFLALYSAFLNALSEIFYLKNKKYLAFGFLRLCKDSSLLAAWLEGRLGAPLIGMSFPLAATAATLVGLAILLVGTASTLVGLAAPQKGMTDTVLFVTQEANSVSFVTLSVNCSPFASMATGCFFLLAILSKNFLQKIALRKLILWKIYRFNLLCFSRVTSCICAVYFKKKFYLIFVPSSSLILQWLWCFSRLWSPTNSKNFYIFEQTF